MLSLLVNFVFDKTAVKVFSSVAPATDWMVREARGAAVKVPSASEIQVCLEQMRRGNVG